MEGEKDNNIETDGTQQQRSYKPVDELSTDDVGRSAFDTERQKREETTADIDGSDDDEDDDTTSFGASVDDLAHSTLSKVEGSSNVDKYATVRREKRLAMNRESARNRRKRKKMLIETLEDQVSKLKKSNQQYQITNESLTAKVRTLENELVLARVTISHLSPTGNITAGAALGGGASSMTMQLQQHQMQLQNQQLQNQTQLLQHQINQQQRLGPVFPNPIGTAHTPMVSQLNDMSQSLDSNNNPDAASRSFVRTGEISGSSLNEQVDHFGGNVFNNSSNNLMGEANLSRLMQAQFEHYALQGRSPGMMLPSSTDQKVNTTAWGGQSGNPLQFTAGSMDSSMPGQPSSSNIRFESVHPFDSTDPTVPSATQKVSGYGAMPTSNIGASGNARSLLGVERMSGNQTLEDLLRQRNMEELLRPRNNDELQSSNRTQPKLPDIQQQVQEQIFQLQQQQQQLQLRIQQQQQRQQQSFQSQSDQEHQSDNKEI